MPAAPAAAVAPLHVISLRKYQQPVIVDIKINPLLQALYVFYIVLLYQFPSQEV